MIKETEGHKTPIDLKKDFFLLDFDRAGTYDWVDNVLKHVSPELLGLNGDML